ncbi:hypothetical protein PPL_06511 [Heterostelium album PN500]|uniref:Uncharacterized protein n=1 Tax=Heterostelium pallidum (strain ATCC 26659 / Pp 5 / PN500) TaxID=670386 RepID=D3BDC8_HETP5|nr:hypothetical protein PPL_06511 [Heterostelium album PN500]EFA80572.1 hypothetical protein PPL_06511 [Heterostelium album PN500]|eukprot:XP_020432692.1 hypothetical protein PPL_06511 [Heterostelium album PN500]
MLITNNSNHSHQIVNLPHLLLFQIINNLEDTLDRICFSLSYGLLQSQLIGDFKNFHLRSYANQLENSKQLKENCTLFIGNKNEININLEYDYISTYDEVIQSKYIIPKNITKVVFSEKYNRSVDALKSKLAESNVTSLKFGADYNQPFAPGCLPDNIKEIVLFSEFNDLKYTSNITPHHSQYVIAVAASPKVSAKHP